MRLREAVGQSIQEREKSHEWYRDVERKVMYLKECTDWVKKEWSTMGQLLEQITHSINTQQGGLANMEKVLKQVMDVVHETLGKVSDRVVQLEKFESGVSLRMKAFAGSGAGPRGRRPGPFHWALPRGSFGGLA